jgi:signal transduction histidine kinase
MANTVWIFLPPEDAERDWALFQKLRAGLIDHYQLEKRYFRRDGSLVWGSLSISLLKSSPFPLVLAMVEDVTAKKTAEEALSSMCRKLIESQEQDRTRIWRELHDDINQRLAMLAMALEQHQNNPGEVQLRLQELREEMIAISSDVQALSHELHSSKLKYLGVVSGMRS